MGDGMIKDKFLNLKRRFDENKFLFSELVKRDFKKKYKRTYLGMLWSLVSPLLTLLVMSLVFKNFFARDFGELSYTIYLFCGNIVYSYFSDATNGGMTSLFTNAPIFTKVNVPKYLFLFSRNISSLINFGLTLVVFFIFCIFEGITFTWSFFLLIIPIASLIIFNIGIGLILSALFVFFRDMQYLWSIFTLLIMYMSAIFYTTDGFGPYEKLFLLNPIFVYIKYFRIIVLYNQIPSIQYSLLTVGYALAAFFVGALIYKKCNHKFLYYV